MALFRCLMASLLVHAHLTRAFFVGSRPASRLLSLSSENKEQPKEEQQSTLDVIQECMGSSPLSASMIRTMKPGLSGFSTDPKLGFVAILTSGNQCATVVVSHMDLMEVRSPEALCMVQLAGGMDLGTTILPPDLLERWVVEELELEEGHGAIRPRLWLLKVNGKLNPPALSAAAASSNAATSGKEEIVSSDARNAKLNSQIEKFMASIKSLPDVAGSSESDVMAALQIHANADGDLDRAAFTSVLDELRRLSSPSSSAPSKIRFDLVVSLDGQEYTIPAPAPTVQALGLALRHGADVSVSKDCLEFPSLDVSTRFPKFRPIEELREDAQLMDGFIPNMFAKAKIPPGGMS